MYVLVYWCCCKDVVVHRVLYICWCMCLVVAMLYNVSLFVVLDVLLYECSGIDEGVYTLLYTCCVYAVVHMLLYVY